MHHVQAFARTAAVFSAQTDFSFRLQRHGQLLGCRQLRGTDSAAFARAGPRDLADSFAADRPFQHIRFCLRLYLSEDLSTFIAKQSQSLWDDLQVTDPEHCPAVARLRRALDLSKAVARAKDSHPSAAPASAATPPATNVWAEHAPPRLDADAVQRMQSTFKPNYPGEHLDNDCMPSIRLLSIVHLWFAPRGTIKWVPWQLRMSQRQYQDIMEARMSRALCTEAQLVSSALFDETPELSIERAHLSPAWLARAQQIFRNAIALCGGAHLAVLKAFDKKILDICTQSLASDSGLRTVNTHELLNADRKLWNEISSLHSEGWTLDEALHEMTSIRADIHALLQPRARPRTPKGPGKGNKGGKGNGKKGGKVQTRLKEDRQVAALTETMKNLQLKHGNKTLCLRFNRTECNDKNCKFAHLCAVRLLNGQACGQRHPASQHRTKAPADKTEPPAPPAART